MPDQVADTLGQPRREWGSNRQIPGGQQNLKELLSVLNYKRGLAQDERNAAQDEFTNKVSLANLRRGQATDAQKAFKDQLELHGPDFQARFPWAGSGLAYLQGAAQRGADVPAATNLLQGALSQLAQSNEVLFTGAGGQPITGAQAVELLTKGTGPGGWWDNFWTSKETLAEWRQQAAEALQQAALGAMK